MISEHQPPPPPWLRWLGDRLIRTRENRKDCRAEAAIGNDSGRGKPIISIGKRSILEHPGSRFRGLHLSAVGSTDPTPHQTEPRPVLRSDCLDGGCNAARPCPWVSCKHHLALDVTPRGNVHLLFPFVPLGELPETCALDVADRGSQTLAEVGTILGVVRERVRQIETKAIEKLRALFEDEAEEFDV